MIILRLWLRFLSIFLLEVDIDFLGICVIFVIICLILFIFIVFLCLEGGNRCWFVFVLFIILMVLFGR